MKFYNFLNFELLCDSPLRVSIVNVGSYEHMTILFC